MNQSELEFLRGPDFNPSRCGTPVPTGSRQKDALNTIAELAVPGSDALSFPWHHLRYQHTQAIRTKLAEKYKPATANKMLAALRRVLKECWRLKLVPTNDFHMAADVPRVKGVRLPVGRALTQDELRKLFRVCNRNSVLGARDTALLATLYGCGARRAELVTLQLTSFDVEKKALCVLGKGNKERLVPVPDWAMPVMTWWLEQRGTTPGALFLPLSKGGHIGRRHKDGTLAMTPQAVLTVLRRLATQAGVKAFSPHDTRRTYISSLLDAGADLSAAQKPAGHSSPTTTTLYDRRGEEAKRAAVAKLPNPFGDARGAISYAPIAERRV